MRTCMHVCLYTSIQAYLRVSQVDQSICQMRFSMPKQPRCLQRHSESSFDPPESSRLQDINNDEDMLAPRISQVPSQSTISMYLNHV